MSSTTSRPSEAIPTPPVFSYAQAAKGRTPSTAASAVQSSQTTSGVSTPHKDTVSTVYTPSAGSERGVGSVNGSHEVVSKSDIQGDVSAIEPRIAPFSKPVSAPASPSFGTASTSTLPKEDKDDEFTIVGGSSSEPTRERHIQGGNVTEKSAEEKEGRRSKKGKKQRNAEKDAEKEKEEAKPEILVPAPIPTVNFWLQRREEAAKAKPSLALTQSPQAVLETSPSSDAKPVDAKRRGKPVGAEEGDKNAGASVNGMAKELSNSSKGQKKGSDVTSWVKDEQSNKRAGPRGSRASEKDDKSSTNQLPPPVEDALSWPTPETALEEEKRKVQEKSEKEEKDDSGVNKQPRPKEKWVTVPYIPTVTFNTPLPTRGGRGRGGARGGRTEAGGRAGNAGTAGEKMAGSSTVTTSPSAEGHTGKDSGVRAASLPPNSNRQPDQTTPRSQRKPPVAATVEKAKNDSLKDEAAAPTPAVAAHTEPTSQSNHDQSVRGDDSKASKQEQIQGNFTEGQLQPRSSRQSESTSLRGSEANFGKDNGQLPRDRGDSRSDRQRGGFRGRGGHNAFPNGQHPPHAFTNGHPPQPPNGYPVRQSSGPYSPPLQQAPFSNQYPPPARGGRGGSSRSQSIPNNGIYSHFRPNSAAASQHMAPLQTSNPMFDYPIQAMSAGPYNPYIDNVSILAMVTMQLEYYFSIDNLCKDVYLRKHMDGQGYVFLTFISGFKRIQSLTQDFELLKYACQESEIIDLVRGGDGVDRLRRKEGWEKWVLAIEERDEAARHPGPDYVIRPYAAQRPQPMQQMMMPNHHAMSPPPFSPNGGEQSFGPFGNGAHASQPVNGNGNTFPPETPLSAAVPDFAPGLFPINGTHDPLEAEVTFNDEEVANLTLVFASPKGNSDSKPKLPFHNSSSRTFSNGSIDGRSIAEEIHDESRQGRTLTNGTHILETSPEGIRRSRSPFSPLSPTGSPTSNGPPVMWVKGQRQQVISEHNTEELYTDFRARALKKREISEAGETHADMKLLYEFWSHFLCRNFNLTMYNEFRTYAFEDARDKASSGMKNLISYYDEVLNSKKKVIPESLARHYVDIVKNEESGDRPAFEKLRAAWRNGALDMKSRKKIDNLADSKLREELERAPHQRPS